MPKGSLAARQSEANRCRLKLIAQVISVSGGQSAATGVHAVPPPSRFTSLKSSEEIRSHQWSNAEQLDYGVNQAIRVGKTSGLKFGTGWQHPTPIYLTTHLDPSLTIRLSICGKNFCLPTHRKDRIILITRTLSDMLAR